MNSSRSTLEHMTTVLMGLPFPAALMDGEGTFLTVNGSWISQENDYPASGISSGPGGNLLALCLYAGTNGGLYAHAAILRVLQGQEDSLVLPYGGTEHSRSRPLELHIGRLPASEPLFLVRIHDASAEQFERDRTRLLDLMTQGRPRQELLQEIAQMVEHLHPAGRCAVLLLDGHTLRVGAAPRIPEAFLSGFDGLDVRERLAALPAVPGAEYTQDLSQHPYWGPYLQAGDMQAFPVCASLPVFDRSQRLVGALALCLPADAPISDTTGELLKQAQHLTSIVIEHDALIRELEHRALHDDLTGLPNRALFDDRLQRELDRAAPEGRPVAVLFLDIDDFKAINDAGGHNTGDAVLGEVARRLRACLKPGETLARFAGDEFVAILPDTAAPEAVERAAGMSDALRGGFTVAGRDVFIMMSIGIAVSSGSDGDAQTLQRHADVAMYRAKTLRTGTELFESELPQRATQRLELLSHLRRAEELGELALHFQPQMNLDTGQPVGAEALIRWQHPQLGLVSPAEFIPLAEDSGLIIPIGRWVLAEACRQGLDLLGRAPGLARIAVNVSALQFAREDFVDMVAEVLRDTCFPPQCLELELTERIVMRDVDSAVRRMQALRDLGVSIALDDFGTGFSSLSYLPNLPLNVLKIDRSFVAGAADGRTLPIVRAIMSMAEQFGFDVIAEGIETAGHVQAMLDVGCRFGQGYHFALPAPAAELWPAPMPGPRR